MRLIFALLVAMSLAALAACERPAEEDPMVERDAPPPDSPPAVGDAPPPDAPPPPVADAPPPDAPPAVADAPPPMDAPPTDVAEIPQFNDLDQANEGFITMEEAEAFPPLAEHFDQYDRNNDGVIDEAEFAQFQTDLETGVGPMGEPGMMDDPGAPGAAPMDGQTDPGAPPAR
jgi:hypothetical protein